MTVAERKGSVERTDGPTGDRFPVGMRVLAVDDDPTCLKLLESLLLRCQYHVTTANEAITALKMLRENKDKYDLVISDVHMPDMDGFKLLELVGLEMDLPVIMLSANGQTEAVMKGITHGACDYLLKPIRIEELRNIWQHVVRRRRSEAMQHNNSDSGEDCEKAQIGSTNMESDHNRKNSKKRKDESEDDSDEHDDEDSSTQKKQRVVWSVELHRKFVAAVNQLGVDKAVPKKILDIMNVEKLTRENVASHLQKYRLFLKKANAMAKSQANLVAALRCRNPGYIPMGSMEGLRNFHPMAGYRQIPVLTPFQQNGALGLMNRPSVFGQQGLMPSRTAQLGNTFGNISNHANNLRKPGGIANLGHPHGSLFQGMPVSLGLDKLQQPVKLQEANNHFPAMGGSNSSVTYMDNTLRVPSSQQCIQSGILGGQHTTMIPSLSSDTSNIGDSYHLHDPGRFSGTWQGAVPADMYAASASAMTARSHGNALSSNCLHNGTPTISHMDSSLNEITPESLMVVPVCDTVSTDNVQLQDSLLGGNELLFPSSSNENSRFLNNFVQKWEGQEQPLANNPSLMFSSSQALPNSRTAGSVAENPAPRDGQGNENLDAIMIGQSSSAPFAAEERRTDCHQTSKEHRVETGKSHGGFSPSGCNMGDLVDAINKSERDDVPFFDEDIYSLGTCM